MNYLYSIIDVSYIELRTLKDAPEIFTSNSALEESNYPLRLKSCLHSCICLIDCVMLAFADGINSVLLKVSVSTHAYAFM